MLRILYEDFNSQDNFSENIFHNMMLSDMYFNTETLRHSSYSWLVNNPDKNFQDLETLFRENNFNTYLIAKKISIPENFILKTPNNNVQDLLYECHFSCKPSNLSLQEVLDNYPSYEENFENLSKSGNLCIISDQNNDYVDNSTSLIKKLMNNQIKLIFKKLTPKESIEQMSEDITKSTGHKPTISIIGKLNDDCPIMAFLLQDGSMASNIAWAIKKENNQTLYQLVDLNEYYAKK